MGAVIIVEGLRKSYGDSVAVRDISFCVEEGEIFGILGPNDAGKTTTVECLQGLPCRLRTFPASLSRSWSARRCSGRSGL